MSAKRRMHFMVPTSYPHIGAVLCALPILGSDIPQGVVHFRGGSELRERRIWVVLEGCIERTTKDLERLPGHNRTGYAAQNRIQLSRGKSHVEGEEVEEAVLDEAGGSVRVVVTKHDYEVVDPLE